MTFEPLADGRPLASIAEEGWRNTGRSQGILRQLPRAGCRMQMLCALKAYLEYGINLREGMFK